jgi:LacI family transcriptional regulator/LacI family repressor for deo operon, udp, cdd, tsx, nupC, and nupG
MVDHNVSIKDIAQVAGVSHTTISRALRNSPLISDEVKESIQKLAQEMGYVPNTVAQSLKTNRTSTVGLVVTTISDPFVGRVMRGIEDVAQRFNQSVFLSASYNDSEREAEIIQTFRQRQVDGIIIASSKITPQGIDNLQTKGIPTVLINQQADAAFDAIHSVTVDDYAGAYQAVEYLLGLGHQRIGYIGAGNRPRSNRIRYQAYQDALRGAGIEPQEAWVRIASAEHRYHTDDVADGQALAESMFGDGLTALFCYNDMIAIGVLMVCREQSIPVPGQLSVMGFDDVELAQYVTPSLTTIHQPKLRLGQAAMEMLVELLVGRSVENSVFAPELMIRTSTGQPPG